MEANKVLEINHLGKTFGDHMVLKDIDFKVHSGDVTCMIGASGSGKSTLLHCVNLLETPSSGEIIYHGTDITDRKVNMAHYRAKVGMVFQSFYLFNNMTVLDNCMIGQTQVLKRSSSEAKEYALEYLAEEGLTMIIVTHEMAFARDVANHVVFMADGVIAEEGTPHQIFEEPENLTPKNS